MINISVLGFICLIVSCAWYGFMIGAFLFIGSDRHKLGNAEWIKEEDRVNHWHCSHCKYVLGITSQFSKYCPNCGYRMRDVI